MIDINYDFTSDSYNYWDGFWDRKEGLGAGYSDPDSESPMLQEYHRVLWSRKLPNGETMDLKKGSGSNYLTWKDFRFGSDAIIVSFRYLKYKSMIDAYNKELSDYKSYWENLIRRAYTIGGMMIFPKHVNSMNQNKGTNKFISDRWDLTLECIRRHYVGEESPLTDIIESDRNFYDLFVDFKGFVDFFFLQDCVSSDYSKVTIWEGDGTFKRFGLPETLDGYKEFLKNQFEFLERRNQRIKDFDLSNYEKDVFKRVES